MDGMFYNAGDFNQDLSGWNVCNVTNYSNFDQSADAWVLPRPIFGACISELSLVDVSASQ